MANYFEEMMNFQKNMFSPLKNMFQMEGSEEKEQEIPSLSDYFRYMSDFNQTMLREAYKFPKTFSNAVVDSKIFDQNMFTTFNPQKSFWENMMNYNKMFTDNMSSPMEMLNKMQTNFNAFVSAKDVYEKMMSKDFDVKNVKEAMVNWRDSYMKYVSDILIPMAPEELRPRMIDAMGYVKQGVGFYDNLTNPIFENLENVGLFEGPKAYFDQVNKFQREYFEKLKAINPDFKYNEKLQELAEKSLEGAKKYNESLGKYYEEVLEISKTATEKAAKEFEKEVQEGLKPRNFEEFYGYLTSKVEEYTNKAMEGKELKALYEQYKDAFETYAKENEELMKEYYINFQQPVVKDDVNQLQSKVDSLTKEVEKLTKELKNK